MRRFWTDAEIALLRSRYSSSHTPHLARELGHAIRGVYAKASALGLHKSPEYLASPEAGRLRKGDGRGGRTRFNAGQVPWNKGSHWTAGGRSVATRFAKGHTPHNAAYEIGDLRWNGEYVDIKIATRHPMFRPFHLWLWEQENGPLPSGHAVSFNDGDVWNIDRANLQLVSRAELLRRNSIHRLPPELRRAITLLGALKRQIRERNDATRKAA